MLEENSYLEIIEELGNIPFPNSNSRKRKVVKVKCICGNTKNILMDNFKKTKSCGCLNKLTIKLGEVFDKLTVVEDLGVCTLPKSNTKARCVKCKCECGNYIDSQYSNIKYGNTKSCGCLQSETSKETVKIMIESNVKHGDAMKDSKYHRLYNSWCRMRYRCYNVNHEKYKWYGGAGIKVCSDWHDYLSFKEWALNNGYDNDLTIDRIDVTGNYEPLNCQWLTAQENIEKEYTIDREMRKRMR
ncbi:hypothetical protein [Bacillus phage vB_BanS-Thrax2]|nr:hypothetical protein [Bacillus phage vB_BanS-Thrax2]